MTLSIRKAKTLLRAMSRRRILVVGDLMLDRYITGGVSRISPEAPVPVVRVRHEKNVPGGASNVASNIRSLGGQAAVAGFIGRDAAGRTLRRLLAESGVGLAAVQPAAATTVKTRVVAEHQQVVRVDWDAEAPAGPRARHSFLARLAREISRCDGVVVEDYGKGVVDQAIVDHILSLARARKLPVGYDPKENCTLNVRGITLATPNRREAFHCAGLADPGAASNPLRDGALRAAGERLIEIWQPQYLMITLGAQGMLLLGRGLKPIHVPTRATEVFDVSGAGDTVIAVSVAALAAGAPFLAAAELANYAAGVVVGKLGTATCTPEELFARMGRED